MTDRVQHLLRSCELHCVKDCCGLSAFDFRPINIAAYLIADTQNENAPGKARELLEALRSDFKELRENGPNQSGFYIIEEISDGLNEGELQNFESELVHNISVALKLITIDGESSFEPETHGIYIERREAQAKAAANTAE